MQANDSDSELKRPQSSASGSTNHIHSNRANLTVASGVSKSPSFGSISRPLSNQSAMRPTISSANKAAASGGGKVGAGGGSSAGTPMKSLQPVRRISSAVSTGDIQQALHDSSSSEDTGGTEPKTNVKARVMSFEKTVGGRNEKARSLLLTPPTKTNPARRSLFNSPVTPTTSSTSAIGAPRSAPTTTLAESGHQHDTNKVLSRASCELAIEAMKAATEQLLLLQRRLAGGTGSSEGSESNLSDRERAELLQLLSTASVPIIQSLKTLQFPPAGIELDRLANATSPQPSENNPLMVQMMQQYSDMLLSMIHQRMGVPAPPSPR